MPPRTSIFAVRTTIGQERSVTDLITTAVIGEPDIWECPFCSEQFNSEEATREHMATCPKKKSTGEPKLVYKNPLLGRVKAILVPETLRGYVFIETEEYRDVEIAISGVPHVRGRVSGKVTKEEIDKYLVPKPAAEGISVSDIVEIISGPFKGERAKVTRVDAAKEELVIELIDSPVTIPMRIHADFIKLVEKATEEEVPAGEAEEEGEEEEESFWSRS